MASIEQLIPFLLATAVFAYMPGPALLYTAAQTIARGRRAGWMTALGIHIGGYVHVIAAALGLSALFAAVPALYATVKLVGAAYLVWLGVQLFLSSRENSAETSTDDKDGPHQRAVTQRAGSQRAGWQKAFWQSASVEILNPKTALFYIAFLPQFTDSSGALALWAQLLILGTFVNVMFSSADIICVLLSSTVAKHLRNSPSGIRIAQRIGGSILVALGINLAVSNQ